MPIPVISVAQMREWERVTWSLGVQEDAVMRNAGKALAALAEKLTRPDDFILFLAGKGHNGDDAAYACDFLANRRGELLRITEPEHSAQALAAQLERKPALVVDGLFGIGLDRELSSAWIDLIEHVNLSGCRVLAVDVPSGLNADTGLPLGAAIRAAVTLTFGAVKGGLLRTSAAPLVGRLEVAVEIGLSACPFTTEMGYLNSGDFVGFPPARMLTGHKGTFGHLAIIAGSRGWHGAAVLAARGAQRAQPGLITVLTQEDAYLPVACQLQSVMVQAITGEITLPDSATAVVVGPGLASVQISDSFQRAVRRLWQESPLPILADASALGWLPEGPCPAKALRVITPHPGEAARMLQSTVAEVQGDRVRAVRELSARWGGCYVVLKGHQTVIGRVVGEVLVNSSGNPHLAQGGSGDLLSGYLGGWLAQSPPPSEVARFLSYGVWRHGAAADSLFARRPSFTVEELAEELGQPCEAVPRNG